MALLQLVATTSSTTHIHNIHWNASNPMFRRDNDENVIDIDGSNHQGGYDQVNIVCPVYKPGSSLADMERYIIYSVSKEEYDTCRITQPNPKIVALCNQPQERMYFTITFRSFTPTPGGLEFSPGRDYYFISTSSRSDIHRRVGGGCSSHNMKVTFRVSPAEEVESNAIDGELTVNSARPVPPPVRRGEQSRLPWSMERDFRRRFSPSHSSSPSYRTRYYHHHQQQQQEERRPKDFGVERRQASARHTSGEASSAPVACSVSSLVLLISLAQVLLR